MKLLPLSSATCTHQHGHAAAANNTSNNISNSKQLSSFSSSTSSSPSSPSSSSPTATNGTTINSVASMEQHRLPLFNHSDFIWRYGPLTFSSLPPTYPSLDFKNHLPGNLACDPRLWNKEDVLSFLRWCEVEFDLQRFDIDLFQMNGKALCLLTKQDLGERCPGAGDLLYNILRWLIRDGSSPAAHISPHSPVTPHFPLTPSWCVPLSAVPQPQDFSPHSGSASVVTTPHNSVTLSPAPSVDSQSGSSPKQLDQSVPSAFSLITGAYKNGTVNNGGTASSGSNQSDSEADEPTDIIHSPGPISLTSTTNSPPYSPRSLPKSSSSSSSSTTSQLFFPPTENSTNSTEPNTNGRLLWDFLQQLLNDSLQRYTNYITWKNRESGVFKIVDPPGLAKLWGIQKNHLSMNYDKMSRALRYYYRVNILRKVQGERHCYQFLRNPSELKSIKNISLLRQQVSSSVNSASSIKNEPIDDNGEDDIRPTDLSMSQSNGRLQSPHVNVKDDTESKFQFPQDLSINPPIHLQLPMEAPENYSRQLVDGRVSHSPSPVSQIVIKMEDTS